MKTVFVFTFKVLNYKTLLNTLFPLFSLFLDNVNLQGHYSAKDKENFIDMYLLHSEIVHEALKTESNTLLLIYSSLLTVPRR